MIRFSQTKITIEKKDRYLSQALALQVLLAGIKNIMFAALPFAYNNRSIINVLTFAIIGLLYLIAFIKAKPRLHSLSRMSLLVIVVVAATFITSLVFFYGNVKYWSDWLLQTIVYCFLSFIIISLLDSFDWLIHFLENYSYILIVVSFIGTFLVLKQGHTTSSTWSSYSMSMSYVILFATMWCLFKFFRNKSKFALLFAFIGAICILLCGSRNPLLAIIVYVLVQFIRKSLTSKASFWKIITFLLLVGALLFVIFSRIIIDSLYENLQARGIYSRTLDLIRKFDTEDFTSGRSDIHESLFAAILQHPIFGLGIAGDSATINESAHSLYLSILSTYGLIVGPFLIVSFIGLCLWSLVHSFGLKKEILVLFLCFVIPRSFTGGDIWNSDIFWWLLAIICVITKKAKTNNAFNSKQGNLNGKRIAYY